MIRLTRFGGEPLLLNAELIQYVEARPDTFVTLANGERLSRLWRYVFVQMLDDYTSVLHHVGIPAAAGMWSCAPRSTGGNRVDAAFAAMVEYLARRDGRAQAAPYRIDFRHVNSAPGRPG